MDQANIGAVPQSVKYAIIGAGIHGLSTAFHLAQTNRESCHGSFWENATSPWFKRLALQEEKDGKQGKQRQQDGARP
ncbi:MAG: hypothetical protein WBQ20_14585, partial [Methyloceanibacter sp.]